MVATSIANARRGRLLQRLAIGVGALTLVAGAADGGRLATSAASAMGVDAVLEGRSPGQRLWAELTKGKAAALAAPKPDRQARALPRVRNPAAAETGPSGPAETVTGPSDIFGPSVLDAAPVPPLFAGGLPPEPVPTGFYGGPSFIPAPGIGGGIGGGGGGGGGDIPPGQIPGVPEPATWLLMILGFGALGFRLRKRRAHGLADAR